MITVAAVSIVPKMKFERMPSFQGRTILIQGIYYGMVSFDIMWLLEQFLSLV